MRVLGLTGGVGMGKSAAGRILERLGCHVIDTDTLARYFTQPGQPALAEIRQAFGEELVDSRGELKRELLAERVFGDDAERVKLEAILHPRIRQAWLDAIQALQGGGGSLAVVIVPLLFETDAAGDVDRTVCVACPEPIQYVRLSERGWTREQMRQRIRAQWPIRRKIELADHVIWNCAGLDLLEAQLMRVLARI